MIYFSNIQHNPADEKYRKIRKENKSFHSKVWRWESAQHFLYAVGWIDVGVLFVVFVTEMFSLIIFDNISYKINFYH